MNRASGTAEQICWLGVSELSRLFRQKQLSPCEVARVVLDRIEEVNPSINAFVHVDPDATLAMARASQGRWMKGQPLGDLDGIPVSVKDLVAVSGWPLWRGSLALVNDPLPNEDAAPVSRLREAGCVFIGKTATSDHGSKPITRSPVHGVTRNPYDLTRTPGGSSGGAGAALAAGLGALAVGTDGAGSIRIPAAWSGIVGMKPSYGRVPIYPPAITMPHAVTGPMARNVRDMAVMLDVMSREDWRDPYAAPVPFDLESALAGGWTLRVGVTYDYGLKTPALEPGIRAAVEEAGQALRDAGATLVEIEIKWPTDPYEPFIVLFESTYAGLLSLMDPEKAARVDPDLVSIARRGRSIDILTYHRALSQRCAIAAHSKALFREVDVLIGPVTPTPPPLLEHDAPEGFAAGDWLHWCPFGYVWNMTGQPAASVPAGYDALGLPIGVQVVGATLGEPQIIQAALTVEGVNRHKLRRPTLAMGKSS
jgi:aspartyl-tRNA(Asn)/glutamyl-tRNA(Gln) amidotransferase subunit A